MMQCLRVPYYIPYDSLLIRHIRFYSSLYNRFQSWDVIWWYAIFRGTWKNLSWISSMLINFWWWTVGRLAFSPISHHEPRRSWTPRPRVRHPVVISWCPCSLKQLDGPRCGGFLRRWPRGPGWILWGGPVSAAETGDFGRELGGIHVKSSNMALKREWWRMEMSAIKNGNSATKKMELASLQRKMGSGSFSKKCRWMNVDSTSWMPTWDQGHLRSYEVSWDSTSWWFGTWFLWLSTYWECHTPKWRSHSFQRGWLKPPTTSKLMIFSWLVVSNMVLLSRIYGMSSFPFDELIFFKMVTTTREIFWH